MLKCCFCSLTHAGQVPFWIKMKDETGPFAPVSSKIHCSQTSIACLHLWTCTFLHPSFGWENRILEISKTAETPDSLKGVAVRSWAGDKQETPDNTNLAPTFAHFASSHAWITFTLNVIKPAIWCSNFHNEHRTQPERPLLKHLISLTVRQYVSNYWVWHGNVVMLSEATCHSSSNLLTRLHFGFFITVPIMDEKAHACLLINPCVCFL